MIFSDPFHPILPSQQKPLQWKYLYGSAQGLAIVQAARLHENPIIVVTPDLLFAQQLEQDVQFFMQLDSSDILPIFQFPDRETLPYDSFSPHQDILSERLNVLSQLPTLQRGILIVSMTTLMHQLPPCKEILKWGFILEKGQILLMDQFRDRLIESGYRSVSKVMEHGEFSVRGSIVDLYPMGSKIAYRIDWMDDGIDSIRIFDCLTQRSIEKIDRIQLLPAHEIVLNEQSIALFRENFQKIFQKQVSHAFIYREISEGRYVQGIEYYLPLFFDQTHTLLDYAPSKSVIIQIGETIQTAEQFWQNITLRYEQLRYDVSRPILNPPLIFISPDHIVHQMESFAYAWMNDDIDFVDPQIVSFETKKPMALPVDYHLKKPFQSLQSFLSQYSQDQIIFCAETVGRKDSLFKWLKNIDIHPVFCTSFQECLQSKEKISLMVASVTQGFICVHPAIILITESQLFEELVFQRRRRKQVVLNQERMIQNLNELHAGDAVVHLNHGVGRFLGLKTIEVEGEADEYLILEYAHEDKLYVPVSSLHLIQRYSGSDSDHPPLHKLGSAQWSKARRKAIEKIYDVATELLEIYAHRSTRTRPPFQIDFQEYQTFVQCFPFEETIDQTKAIEHVLNDLQSTRPMDRLICGDVGFGKTEVAMRAAFVVVHNLKQVAIFVPTTLLAQQHTQSFRDRFANWPVRIETLSRFQTKKQQALLLKVLMEGKIDIMIGTHALLQSQVRFKNLGLLIIDEEHRLGVRQKERLRSLRAEIDILTLTATPIPRTLHLSLSAIRDLSIIATPPLRRRSVKTFFENYALSIIKEAVLREISRGGQIYFLHNQVETIEKMHRELRQEFPTIRIGVAHGQLPKKELERVMIDFYHRKYHLLVCTTIIESGIDIPSANTIIINKADRLGLAELYQLRGRVGRSHRQAYAYLLVSSKEYITEEAKKRLNALMASEQLGVGFLIALQDLEIRGAGEILGEEQSGHIQSIGFELYTELLRWTVHALKQGLPVNFDTTDAQSIEMRLGISTIIPEDYLVDVALRLVFYKRIASATDENALDDLRAEMVDRFGLLPQSVHYLFLTTELKLQAIRLGIQRVEVSAQYGIIQFHAQPFIPVEKIIQLVQSDPNRYQLIGEYKLKFLLEEKDSDQRLQYIKNLFQQLA